MYVLTEFLTAHTVREQQSIFELTLSEVYTSQSCASFGTLCVQIGQLFKVQ